MSEKKGKKLTIYAVSKRVDTILKDLNGLRSSLKEVRKMLSEAAEKYEGFARDIISLKENQGDLLENQFQLRDVHLDLQDKFFGAVNLLRDSDPKLADILTDERIVVAANVHRKKRVERMKQEAEKQKDEEEVQNLGEKLNQLEEAVEPVDRGPLGVPDGATTFGGK